MTRRSCLALALLLLIVSGPVAWSALASAVDRAQEPTTTALEAQPQPETPKRKPSTYRNVDGDIKNGPSDVASQSRALCADGTESESAHARGTCAGHGGVVKKKPAPTIEASPAPTSDPDAIARTAKGRIQRSAAARHAFARQTGYPKGRPGYVIDHVIPLACGGKDHPSNMQWQTIAEAKAKDKIERRGC